MTDDNLKVGQVRFFRGRAYSEIEVYWFDENVVVFTKNDVFYANKRDLFLKKYRLQEKVGLV